MTDLAEPHARKIFVTGEYVKHFTPDDSRNPFRKIYRRKKQDSVEIIQSIGPDNRVKRILDIGGGMGRLALQLAESNPGLIVLTDISIDMLVLAEKSRGAATVKSVNADAHRLPFQDRSFEIVAGLDLICHLEKPELALAEFRRVLADGGTLILDSTNSNPLWAFFYPKYVGLNPWVWLKIIRFDGVLPGWEKIVRHYPKKKFMQFVHDAGFRIVKTINYGPRICPKWHLAVSIKEN